TRKAPTSTTANDALRTSIRAERLLAITAAANSPGRRGDCTPPVFTPQGGVLRFVGARTFVLAPAAHRAFHLALGLALADGLALGGEVARRGLALALGHQCFRSSVRRSAGESIVASWRGRREGTVALRAPPAKPVVLTRPRTMPGASSDHQAGEGWAIGGTSRRTYRLAAGRRDRAACRRGRRARARDRRG